MLALIPVPLEALANGEQLLPLPRGAKPVSLVVENETLVLVVLADPHERAEEPLRLRIFAGWHWEVTPAQRYVGSAALRGQVYHVLVEVSPDEAAKESA